jgi:hypothetical protein
MEQALKILDRAKKVIFLLDRFIVYSVIQTFDLLYNIG